VKVTSAITPRTRAAWRTWLQRYHARRDEIWVVYYKRHTGKASVAYAEAVEEALCFGWIDGIVKRLDDERHTQRFTPRRKGSVWSAVNLRRFARLVEQGLVTDAGHAAGPKPGTRVASVSWLLPDEIPDEIVARLRKSPAALKNLRAMAPSYRKHFVHFIGSAKRLETRERRAQLAITLLERNETLDIHYREKLKGVKAKG
jgi:uncharacterized protein YdeI (YjbR/CyaY-like superfamily)